MHSETPSPVATIFMLLDKFGGRMWTAVLFRSTKYCENISRLGLTTWRRYVDDLQKLFVLSDIINIIV